MNPPANESPAPGRIEHRLERIRRREEDASTRVNMNAPCSPFLITTCFGPRSMIQRAAFTRLNSSVSCRASASLSVMRSTCSSSSSRSARRLSIQKFIVSHATSFGLATCVSTSSCSRGSMLPRKTNGALRNCSGIFGRKFEKTPRCVSSVSADVEVVAVAAAPAKRRSLGALEPREVDRPRRERVLRAARSDSRCRSRRRAAPARSGSPTRRRTCPSRRARCRPCRTASRPSRARRSRRRERSCGLLDAGCE